MALAFDRTGGVFLLVDPDGERPAVIADGPEEACVECGAELHPTAFVLCRTCEGTPGR